MSFRDLIRNCKRRSKTTGFSLIELLIVIAIILIILAFALPKLLNARKYAQEVAAQAAIRAVNTAEVQYYSLYGQYAGALAQLGPPTNGTASAANADLIDRELAAGEKGNFRFILQTTPTGYSITAEPTQFGTSGDHTYFSDQSQMVHAHNGKELATGNDPMVGEKVQQQQAK